MPPGDGAKVFVDLSNVAKHELLGFSQHHAALLRWDRLKREWLRTRGEQVEFVLVADESLYRALSAADQRRLRDAELKSELVLVRDADVELLRRAVQCGGTVLSNDRFVDHLRMPGLDRVSLVGWVVRGENLLLVDRTLERLRSAIISARAHKQLLKEAGLGEDSPELRFRWHCREKTCGEDLVPVPVMRSGSAMCPSCGAFLERGNAWRDPIWLKIMHGQIEVNRFVLEEGQAVFVGRGADDDTISLAEDFDHAADVLALDLHQVQLANRGGKLYAVGQETSKGAALRYPVGGQRNFLAPPVPLRAGEERLVSLGWKIALARTPYTVQISGGTGSG
jgi:hypothetical protein